MRRDQDGVGDAGIAPLPFEDIAEPPAHGGEGGAEVLPAALIGRREPGAPQVRPGPHAVDGRYTPGDDVMIALDCAASEYFKDGAYRMVGHDGGARVRIRWRKPCFLARRRLFGW